MMTTANGREHRTFGKADPRCDGQLDALARFTYGHDWNGISPQQRALLIAGATNEALSACKLLSIDQGRRVCAARGIINPKCSPGCPLHEPF